MWAEFLSDIVTNIHALGYFNYNRPHIMQKHQLNIVPTIEAAINCRASVMGDTEGYAVAWPTSENCIGLPSDQLHADLVNFDGYKQLNNPNRM